MWTIEIVYNYTNVVTRLMYGTREEAEEQRAIIAPLLGKDRYEVGKNGGAGKVTLKDKFGEVDVVVCEVKSVRIYDIDKWSNDAIESQVRQEKLKKKLELET